MKAKKTALLFFLSITMGHVFAANYYWKPNYAVLNFDWSDLNNWVTTSGGSVHPVVLPGPADDVIIDPTCLVARVELYDTAVCHSISFVPPLSAGPANPIITNGGSGYPLEVYGSFNGCTNLEMSLTVDFVSGASGNIIDMDTPIATGSPLDNLNVYFKGAGDWTLASPLTAWVVYVENGTLKTNNNNMHSRDFEIIGDSTRSVLFGQSSLVLSDPGGFRVDGTNYTIDADSASFRLKTDQGIALAFLGGENQHYHYVEMDTLAPTAGVSGINCVIDHLVSYGTLMTLSMTGSIHKAEFFGGGSISDNASNGNLVYDTLVMDNTVPPSFGNNGDYFMDSDSTFVNNLLQINSGSGDTIAITEYWGGYANILHLPADTLCLDYLKLRNTHAAGAGYYFAGSNSVDLGNNSGWAFSACNAVATGISTVNDKEDLLLYPNPATSSVTVRNGTAIHLYRIYSVTGALIRAGEMKNYKEEFTIDLTELHKGLYFIELTTDQGVIMKKIAKQ